MWAESMALNDQLQVAAVQKEKYGTKDGALGYTTHHGGRGSDSHMHASLTGRIETIIVLIPISLTKSHDSMRLP